VAFGNKFVMIRKANEPWWARPYRASIC